MKAWAIILTLICISINLIGCTEVKQQAGSRFQENKTKVQPLNGHTGSLLISLMDDKPVPLDVPVDSCNIMYCRWSPDGQWLVYGNKGDLFLYNYKTGKSINLTNTPNRWELMPSWSPDGSRLCFTSRPLHSNERSREDPDGNWVMFGAWGGSPTIIRRDGTGYEILEEGMVWNPSWSSDGKMIAYGSGGSIHLFNLKEHKTRVLSPRNIGLEAKYIGSPSWSPTRHEIALFFSLNDREPTREEVLAGTALPTKQGFALLDLQTNKIRVLYTFEGPFTSYRLPALWNTDGSKLVFHLESEGPVHNPIGLMVTNREGGSLQKIGEAYQVLWEPNGNRLAYIDANDYRIVRIVSFNGDTYTIKTIIEDNNTIEGITWRPALKS
ncbi:MAG TPA: hypothetical protein DD719_02970 [Desulfotomaculum sp.]|nr:hypothetical protein [Desulfotomaculum sp.]